MRSPLPLLLLLLATLYPPPSIASSSSPLSSSPTEPYTTTILHFPAWSPSTPLPFATLSYHPLHPHLSTILSFTPPPPPPANSTGLTRIAIALSPAGSKSREGKEGEEEGEEARYRTTLAVLGSVRAPATGRFRLVVHRDGRVLGVGWRVGARAGAGEGEFDLLVEKEGARPVVERISVKGAGVVLGEDGEEVVEKTMLQKYWWVLVGVAFLAITGGGGDK